MNSSIDDAFMYLYFLALSELELERDEMFLLFHVKYWANGVMYVYLLQNTNLKTILNKMRKEIADKWVAELRSGKYEQGKNHLLYENRYCCLGVLCEMAYTENVCTKQIDKFLGSFQGEQGILPLNVKHWSGIRTNTGAYIDNLSSISLANYNDGGKSFEEISNIIEKNWEKL